MGRKKLYKRKTAKKVYKKTKKSITKPFISAQLGVGFPKRLTTTMKYTQQLRMSCVSGLLVLRNFCANGIWDPDLTGSGAGRPLYFLQYSNLYNHYTVIGSKIKVTFMNDNSNVVPIAVGIMMNDSTTISSSSYIGLSEQTGAKICMLGGGSNAQSKQICNLKYSTKKAFGGSVLGNPELQGNASANPDEISVFTVYCQPADEISTVYVQLLIEIEYIVVWKELRDVDRSL